MSLTTRINQTRDKLRAAEANRKGLQVFIDTQGNLRAARPIKFGEPIILSPEQIGALK